MAQERNPFLDAFKPYIPADQSPAESTFRALVLGAVLGILFGAASVYLGLRVGLTTSASIPIAVMAITILKKLRGNTVLENNIVQTVGSAGESVRPRSSSRCRRSSSSAFPSRPRSRC
jgi:uncharacterized oligopeptide transporter (OPT) family protein